MKKLYLRLKKWFHDRLVQCLLQHYDQQAKEYIQWKYYEMGFTGNGTSLLDTKPTFPKPAIPRYLAKEFDKIAEGIANQRQEAWRRTCIETIGEDPNGWTL